MGCHEYRPEQQDGWASTQTKPEFARICDFSISQKHTLQGCRGGFLVRNPGALQLADSVDPQMLHRVEVSGLICYEKHKVTLYSILYCITYTYCTVHISGNIVSIIMYCVLFIRCIYCTRRSKWVEAFVWHLQDSAADDDPEREAELNEDGSTDALIEAVRGTFSRVPPRVYSGQRSPPPSMSGACGVGLQLA